MQTIRQEYHFYKLNSGKITKFGFGNIDDGYTGENLILPIDIAYHMVLLPLSGGTYSLVFVPSQFGSNAC